MNKQERNKQQQEINNMCDEIEARFSAENPDGLPCGGTGWKRLRSCTAYVYETPKFYALMSYRTLVAIIEKETDTCVDFLRTVYGYTSTSNQHICKFSHDYGCGKWGCARRLVKKELEL